MRRTWTLWASTLALAAVLGTPAVASAAVDLTSEIMSITVDDLSVTYLVRVCNDGSTAAGAFDLGLYYNRASAPSTACSNAPDYSWHLAGLAAYACTNRSHTATRTLGSYTAWSFADSGCSVGESSGSNNQDSQTYNVLPDLDITAFSATVSGTTTTYSVTVTNLGSSTTSTFAIGVFYDLATAPACPTPPAHDRVATISTGLAHGATVTRNWTRTSTPAGAYAARAMVDDGCAITESNEANNTAYDSYVAGPDLYFKSPLITVDGSSAKFTVDVCNNTKATVATGAFQVSLWLDLASTPTCGQTGATHTWSVSSLGPGDCASLSLTAKKMKPGTYRAYWFADPSCSIAEVDEEKNIRSGTYTVASPDFFVNSFTASVSGSDVTYSLEVCNQGASTEVSFQIGLDYSGAAAPTCATTFNQTWSIAGLDHNGCTTKTYTQTGVAPGDRDAWVLADSTCNLTETDENNNTATAPYIVAPTQPDLYITSFTASVTGDTVTYVAVVCNAGTAFTTNFVTSIYYNLGSAPSCASPGTPDHSATKSGGLSAGGCTTVTHVRTGAPAGTFTARAFADRTCVVTEYKETNNASSKSYTVTAATQPDLVVTSLNAAVSGTTVTYTAQVCNNGTAASAASTLGLYQDHTSAPICGETPHDTALVNALAVSACETKTWTKTGMAAGTFTAWVMADSPCGIAESNEGNNTASKGYTVASLPVDAGIQPDTVPTPDSRPPDSQVKLDGGKLDTTYTMDLKEVIDQPVTVDQPVIKVDQPVTTVDGPVTTVDGPVTTVDGPVTTVDGPVTTVDGPVTTVDGPVATTDGGTSDIGSTTVDTGTPAPGSSDDGCSCRVGQPVSADRLGVGLLLAVGLFLSLRRRRS